MAPVPSTRSAWMSTRRPPSTTSPPRVRLHLKPGQKGTKQPVAQYGDRLLCVRCRYDAERRRRLKTVELVIAEQPWVPPPSRFESNEIVGLPVAFADVATRHRVKEAGATWDPERRMCCFSATTGPSPWACAAA